MSVAGGRDAAVVFRWVFLTAWIFLAISLFAPILMEERPLRGSVAPSADPPRRPQPAE